jgi:dTDP-4-dehydrorhamnose 3,5-epimerase-like enzyme
MSIVRLQDYFSHSDGRGAIRGLINTHDWGEINFIESDAGQVRGYHYHRSSVEFFFIVLGEILVKTWPLDANLEKGVESKTVVKAGDAFLVTPMTLHAFETLRPSSWINAMSPRMSDTAKDIHRLGQPE